MGIPVVCAWYIRYQELFHPQAAVTLLTHSLLNMLFILSLPREDKPEVLGWGLAQGTSPHFNSVTKGAPAWYQLGGNLRGSLRQAAVRRAVGTEVCVSVEKLKSRRLSGAGCSQQLAEQSPAEH